MNYALIGYGKMGHAIELAATARGHACKAVVDRRGRGRRAAPAIDAVSWRGVRLAFEFTEPASARDNVLALLRRGVSVVCGTTGWDATDSELRRVARASKAGAVIAANFSIGVNLFYAVVADAAGRYLAEGEYDPWVAEWHHRAKADAPSGTARRLAGIVAASAPSPAEVRYGLQAGGMPRGDVHVAAIRAGHEPGRHVVGFDGPHDAVRLEHVSRGREGLAVGAVIAAEWVLGRRGLHEFGDVLADRTRSRGRKGGRT